MKLSLTLATLVLMSGPMALAESLPFDLETQGQQVCKVGANYPQPVCFERFDVAGKNGLVPLKINIADRVRALEAYVNGGGDMKKLKAEDHAKFGGALFVKPADRRIVAESYSELSLRHIGLDISQATLEKNKGLIPFVASVRWKGRLGMEGTLQVEGYIDIRNIKLDDKENFDQLNELFARTIAIQSFNDSSTEQKMESLRWLEGAARRIHFVSVNGVTTDVDADTVQLLQHVVAPAMYGEVVIAVLTKTAESIVKQLFR